MVIRLPIHLLTIIIGAFFVINSFCLKQENVIKDTVVYNHPFDVLIIDAGHGGLDGGAVTADGTKESDINLSIALKLNAISHLYGVSTVLTRDTADISYPKDCNTIAECKLADQKMRLGLIRDYPHGILFSIHQNYYPSPKVSGVQVLYGHDDISGSLGQKLQEMLCNSLYKDCRRVACEVDDSIYLMKNCGCTAVLIECGFLSNYEESLSLQNSIYQSKIAAVLMTGYLQFTTQNQK